MKEFGDADLEEGEEGGGGGGQVNESHGRSGGEAVLCEGIAATLVAGQVAEGARGADEAVQETGGGQCGV